MLRNTLTIIILSASISLSGCGAMSAMSMLTPGPSVGVDTEVVTGEKEESYGVTDKSQTTTTQKAETIENVYHKLPWWQWVLILLMAGWAIPTPWDMFKGMVNAVRLIFGKGPI